MGTPFSDRSAAKTYSRTDCSVPAGHQWLFILPDLKVCCQLGFPMLNDAFIDEITRFVYVMQQLVRVYMHNFQGKQHHLTWQISIDDTHSGQEA